MAFEIAPPVRHTLTVSGHTLYPDMLDISRRDTDVEHIKVGGGIIHRTNGSIGLEILAAGRFSPDERGAVQGVIESFESDVQTITADGRNYGGTILLEGVLAEKAGESGGTYRLRFGGYEI